MLVLPWFWAFASAIQTMQMLYSMVFQRKQFHTYKGSMCEKLTLERSKFDSTTEALAHFHWLPIRQRINFKIATITHKCIYGTAPQYLKDLLTFTPTPRNLRSSIDTRLIVLFSKFKTFAA